MPERYCPTCGTEVDEDARFCPTCGTTLGVDQPQLPPAPTWPEPDSASEAPEATGAGDAAEPEAGAEPEPGAKVEPQSEPEPAEQPKLEPGSDSVGEPPPHPAPAPGSRAELPWSWPTMLSGWLIGAGGVVGALALIPSLANPVSLLLFLALIGVAATVFEADRLPEIPRLRLIILSVSLVGLGIALERAGFRASGVDSLLLVAMIAAAGGALLVELDRDRPVPPPAR
jgi:zinc-ribbon domain